ncbi:hypothetical protein BX616_001796 [Lobosporangium transversale]|nr:hypothetical protein BX616_001796 [Lobosporangium transversale]
MSLQVNFTTHSHELRAAYEAVLRPADPKNGDNWAMFGYDKGTNDLKVLGRGSGGLEELQDEFMDGKMQYAFVRIVDPYSQLNKFVLIAWCGEGVPESKKGLFNTHLADVAQFLKGYHLQINARCDADVTPAQIMKRAEEGSGSKYSTHKEEYQHEKIQPLQSAYKKTQIPDIAAMQRTSTKPEPAPKYGIGTSKPLVSTPPSSAALSSLSASSPSPKPAPLVPSKLQGRVWPPPASSPSSSSTTSPNIASPPSSASVVVGKSWSTSGGGSSYSASTATSFNKVQPPSSLTSYGDSKPEPFVNKAHQLRLEREAREKEERERIKREIAASEARERQAESTSTAQKLTEERRLQEQREREQEKERELAQGASSSIQSSRSAVDDRPADFNRIREERLAREKEERERAEVEDAARAAREAAKAREQDAIREQALAREEEQRRLLEQRQQQQKRESELNEAERQKAREAEEQKAREVEELRTREAEEHRRMQEEEEHRQRQQEEARRRHEEEEEERQLNQHQDEEEDRRRQFEHEQEEKHWREEAEEQERRLQEQVSAATTQSVALGADALLASADHPELATVGSVSAIVLYSYDKAEENEMTLYEGEIIRNVMELDVGWWSGESEDGTRSGLFPSNYVEIIDQSHGQGMATAGAAATNEQRQESEYEHYAQQHAAVAAAPDHHDTSASALGRKPSAVALYDYQAGEPNEISFSEGDTINEIEIMD